MNICEICGKKTILEEHHICSKSKGGSNNKNNLAYICSNCHKMVHYGLIIIEGRFDACSGNRVVWRKLNEESVTGIKDPEVYIIPNTEHMRQNYMRKCKNET